MKKLLFESSRTFVIFSYGMSHGLLLLRSRKTEQAQTRLDILFQDVRAMEIRAWFEGVKIEEVGPEFLQPRSSNPAEMIEPGNKVYSLSGVGWSGFVVAGIMQLKEDEEEFLAPSALIEAHSR